MECSLDFSTAVSRVNSERMRANHPAADDLLPAMHRELIRMRKIFN